MVGFFFKKRQGDEQREIAVFHASSFDFRIHQLLDAFPHAIAPWPDNHAPTDTRFFCEVGLRNDFLIPAREILRARDA